jgi:hypothetical protein
VEEGEEVGKGYRKVNVVQMLCIHICKWKNKTCGSYSRNGKKEDKENDGGDELKYDILDIL